MRHGTRETRRRSSFMRLLSKKGYSPEVFPGRTPSKTDKVIASGLKFLALLMGQLGKTLVSTVLLHLAETVKPGATKELPSPEKQTLYEENSYPPNYYGTKYPTSGNDTFPRFNR